MIELTTNTSMAVQIVFIVCVTMTVLGLGLCVPLTSWARARARRVEEKDDETRDAIIRLAEVQEETLRRIASGDATRRLPPSDDDAES